MKRRLVIEHGIGETRAAFYEGRRLAELHLRRHIRSAAHIGDIFTGQVIKVDPSVAGAFVDIGSGSAGLLKFSAQKELPKLTDGLFIDVEITKESMAEKGPNLVYVGDPGHDRIAPVKQLNHADYFRAIYPDIAIEDGPVSIIDTACQRQLALKSGGSVTFDQTQALLAIDVDKGGAERVIDVCLEAVSLIASQLRLRGLGGLVVIDFPNLRQPKQRTSLMRAMERAFDSDPAITKFAPLSKFGVIEMTRSQSGPSLDALMNDRFGEPSTETQALSALRRLLREASLNKGAQFALYLPQSAYDWLGATDFDWKSELTARIGERFKIEVGDNIDVKADR